MKKTITSILVISLISFMFSYDTAPKQAVANTDEEKTVILGGESFGIRMFSDGIMVIEIEDTIFGTETTSPAKEAGLEVNDIIKAANGEFLYSNEQFTELIIGSNGESMDLLINRNESEIIKTITPIKDLNGNYRVGMWIKDSAAGIGTITYYDPENLSFGALGHGICESKTEKLIPISFGEVDKATISSVTKSENTKVGSLNGYFNGDVIGEAIYNNECGIFGFTNNEVIGEEIKVADKSEIKTGHAQIYCTVSDNNKKSYDIKIKRLPRKGDNTMVIEITDDELLSLTGGIVQGMSGSPIVQNNKIVGAVTHVLVNNVSCGYGICIEDMINNSCL